MKNKGSYIQKRNWPEDDGDVCYQPAVEPHANTVRKMSGTRGSEDKGHVTRYPGAEKMTYSSKNPR